MPTFSSNIARLPLISRRKVVNLPVELATGADYGLTMLPTKNENTAALVFFILPQNGQSILARHGFEAPLLLRGHN
jgi:hypothetical protein